MFDDTYTQDIDYAYNADEIICGGTGYGLDNKYMNTDGKWTYEGRDIPSPVPQPTPAENTDSGNGENVDNGTPTDGGNS